MDLYSMLYTFNLVMALFACVNTEKKYEIAIKSLWYNNLERCYFQDIH